jgi:hypothetical protein
MHEVHHVTFLNCPGAQCHRQVRLTDTHRAEKQDVAGFPK